MNKKYDKNCVYCKNYNDFEISDLIKDSILKNNLVIFAGGGVSTERRNAFPFSFYEDICDELLIDPKTSKLSFSSIMSKYENQPNGRKKLLQKIRERIEYSKSFDQLYNSVTDFHRELANVHQISEIITTNWDDFFETECRAIPIVIPEDFAFWDMSGRKVLKIHGSINNLSTIIADEDDYKKCYSQLSKNTLGSFLKSILATKTVVFCGYSLTDEDFNKIYSFVQKDLSNILPHSYIITLDKKINEKINLNKMTPIITDASFFLHKLKHFLIEKDLLINDSVYNHIYLLLEILHEIHAKKLPDNDLYDNLNIIYTYSYQDGLSDCFRRALRKKGEGLYLCPDYIIQQVKLYRELKKDKIKYKKYFDVAYIDGYINGLIFFLMDEKMRLELDIFYIYGYKKEIKTYDNFLKILKSKKIYHKAAYQYAKEFLDKDESYKNGGIPHHTAFLL